MNDSNRGVIFNIQGYSVHDGPGIRRSFRHLMLLRCYSLLSDSMGLYRYVCYDDENDHKKNSPRHRYEYLPEAESFRNQSRLHRRFPDLGPEFQRPMGPDEVVIAAK